MKLKNHKMKVLSGIGGRETLCLQGFSVIKEKKFTKLIKKENKL
jgi:hypothetical protein